MIYRFYTGMKTPPSPAMQAHIYEHLVNMFGAFHRFDVVGGHRNERNETHVELVRVYEVVGDFTPHLITGTAEFLKLKHNNEAVLVVASECNFNFI